MSGTIGIKETKEHCSPHERIKSGTARLLANAPGVGGAAGTDGSPTGCLRVSCDGGLGGYFGNECFGCWLWLWTHDFAAKRTSG